MPTRIEAPGTTLVRLSAGPTKHHWTKNILANADSRLLFVSVGSNRLPQRRRSRAGPAGGGCRRQPGRCSTDQKGVVPHDTQAPVGRPVTGDAPASADDLRPVVGFAALSEVAVRTHGSRDDIAAYRTRQQHERLGVEAEPRHLTQRAEEQPTLLEPVGGDHRWVLLRGAVDGELRAFAVRRADL